MRIIAHIDMDAFFAAVEERDHEWLRGRPVVIGADPENGRGRGVVSTANYAARRYGIKSAMPISQAWHLAAEAKKRGEPEAVFIGGDMKTYAKVSDRIMNIIRSHASRIEEASIDEAYADLSHIRTLKKAEALCKAIKRDIKKKEKLTASIGLGPNKLIAKIASDMRKPDGLTVVPPKEVISFLSPLPIRKIPGIGPKTELELKRLNIQSIADLQDISEEELELRFGKWGFKTNRLVLNGFRPLPTEREGTRETPEALRRKSALAKPTLLANYSDKTIEHFYKSSHGIDDLPVAEEREIKSIGEQETFREDTLDSPIILDRFRTLSRSVANRFTKSNFKNFRTVVITVRFKDFVTITRSHTLQRPARTAKILEFSGLKLLMPFLDTRENPRHKKIRLIGIRIENLRL